MRRNCNVCGSFYPRRKKELSLLIHTLIQGVKQERYENVIGANVPHAGITYSGVTAAHVYHAIKSSKPHTIIILGIHHHISTSDIVMTTGDWVTPLGISHIDEEIATELTKGFDLRKNNSIFLRDGEHSIEVQLPFIQYIAPFTRHDIRIVPMAINSHNYRTIDAIGNRIVEVIQNHPQKRILLLSSNDISHNSNLTPKLQEKHDYKLINEFQMGAAKSILSLGIRNTSCSPQNLSLLLNVTGKLGYYHRKLLHYNNDYGVGYFGGIIYK